MKISIKSLTLATLTTLSLTSALTIGSAPVNSQVTRMQRRQPVQNQQEFKSSFKLQANFSALGNWQGTMNNKGDDVLTYIQLNISGNNGTWKHMGSKYNAQTDQWEDTILQQGSLTSSTQGMNVTIQMNNFHGANVVLEGTATNNGTKIAGDVAGTNSGIFSLNKQ